MGLKPIGSEKLKGQDKINRIMELATYGESKKNTANHISTTSFIKEARDGTFYAIVNEKDGYYLKTGINENTLDYINGIRNKKKNRFKSYSAALKKLNLALKPINERYASGEGDSLYEQSSGENKFVLKTPEVEVEDEEIVTDDGMGDEEDFEMDDEMEDDEVAMDDDELALDDEEGDEEEMEGFMKPIQKLTGKLGQKLRDAGEEIGSADIKYVINSVISAVDLDTLDEEDREDILSRFEEDETAYGDEELGDEELAMDDDELAMDDMEDMEGLEDEGEGAEFDMEAMVPESRRRRKNIISEQIKTAQKLMEFLSKKLKDAIAKGEKDASTLTKTEIALLTAGLAAFPAGPIFVAITAILKAVDSLKSKTGKKTERVLRKIKTESLKNRISEQLQVLPGILPVLPFIKPELAKLLKKAKDEKAIQKFTAAQLKIIKAASLVFPAGIILTALNKILKIAKGGEKVQKESLKNRISNLLESYYEKEDPKTFIKDKVKKNKTLKFIEENSNSIEQELATKQYIKENKYSELKGLTKSGLLVIESDDEKIRINKSGRIV